MFKTRAQLKAEAKQLLGQNFGKLFLVTFVPALLLVIALLGIVLLFTLVEMLLITLSYSTDGGSVLISVLGFLFYIVFLATIIITSLFIQIGISYTLLDFIRSKNPAVLTLGNAFQVFKTRPKIRLLSIAFFYWLFLELWALVPFVGIVKSYAYEQTFFLYKDNINKNLPATNYITQSRQLMNGHKMDRFVIDLSFIGWFILSIFTLGLLNIWLVPYYSLTVTNFYDSLLQQSTGQQQYGATTYQNTSQPNQF